MGTGFTRSPVLLKGALIRFDAPLLIPIPNIIIFQYNPETLSRSLVPYEPQYSAQYRNAPGAQGAGGEGATPEQAATARTQPYDPQESFTLRLIVDASDALEKPEFHPIAVATGVADRLAALEMLLYPISEGISLLGSIGGSLGGAAAGAAASVGGSLGGGGSPAGSEIPARNVPVTLFIWGPGRIVPVRVTSFTVEEQTFSPLLYPLRATVSLGMSVLQPGAFQRFQGTGDSASAIPLKPEEELAVGAYKFTMVQKQVLATANLANSVESIINMLSF